MELKFIIFLIVFQLLFSPLSSSLADPGILNFIQSPSLEKPLGETFGLFGYEIGVIGSAVLESLWGSAVDSFFNSVTEGVEKGLKEAICGAAEIAGKAAGAAAGTAAGAAVGAAAGSVVPGVGTAIGAAVGSAVGGLVKKLFGGDKCDPQKELVKEQKKTTQKLSQIIKETMRKNMEPLSRDFLKSYVQARLSREMGKIIESYKVDSIEEYLQIAEKRGRIKGLRDYLKSVSCLSSDTKVKLSEELRPELESLQTANYFMDLLDQTPDCLGGEFVFSTTQIANEIRERMIEAGAAERDRAQSELTGDITPKIKCTEEIELDTGEMFCLEYTILVDSKTLAQATEETVRSASENINLTEDVNTLVSFLKNFDALRVLSIAQMGYQGLTQGQDLDAFLENYYENFKDNIDKACEIYKEQVSPGSLGKFGPLGGLLGMGISALKKTVGGGKTEEYILCKVLMKKQLVFMLQGRNEIETAITRVLSLGISDVNTLSNIINTTTEKIKNLGNKILGTGTSTSNLPSYLVIARLAEEGRINEIPVPPDVVNKYLKAVKLHEDVTAKHLGNINVINSHLERLRDDTYREYARNLIKEFAPIENRLTEIANTRDSLAGGIQEKANILSQKAEINSTIISKYQEAFNDYNPSNWPTFHQFPATKCGEKIYGSQSALCPGESIEEGEVVAHQPVAMHLCRPPEGEFVVRGRKNPSGGTETTDCNLVGGSEECPSGTVILNLNEMDDFTKCAALACVHYKDWRGLSNPFYDRSGATLPRNLVKDVCDYFNLPTPETTVCKRDRQGKIIAKADDRPEVTVNAQSRIAVGFSNCQYTHTVPGPQRDHPNDQSSKATKNLLKNFFSFLKNLFQVKAASLEITAPKNGSILSIGDIVKISWESNLESRNVYQITVSLESIPTGENYELAVLTPPADSFTWQVGKDLIGRNSIFPGRYRLNVTYWGFQGLAGSNVLQSDSIIIIVQGKLPTEKPLEFTYPQITVTPNVCDWARIYNPKWVYRLFPSLWKFGSPINACPYQTSTSNTSGGVGGNGGGGRGGGGRGNECQSHADCDVGYRCIDNQCVQWPPRPSTLIKIKENLFALFKNWFTQKAKAQSVSVDLKVQDSDGPLTIPASTTVRVRWDAENANVCQVEIVDNAGSYNPDWATSTKASAQHHIYDSRTIITMSYPRKVPITYIQYVATCRNQENSASDSVIVYVGQTPTPKPGTGAIQNEDIITSLQRFLNMLGGTDQNKITEEAKKRYLLTGQPNQTPLSCGNGICEPSLGEDENTCSIDCFGGRGRGDEIENRPPLYLKIKDYLFAFIKNTLFQKIFSSEQVFAQSQNICQNCELKKGQRRFLFDIVNLAYMDFRPNVDLGQSSFLETLNAHLSLKVIKNLSVGFGSVPAEIDLINLKASPEQLAEIKAYLNLKLNIVRALLKYVNKFPNQLDITLGSPYFPPVINTAQFLKEYQSILENLIIMINIHLGGSFQENLQQLLQLDQEVVRLSNQLDELQDEVLPKVLKKFAQNDVPVYSADVWKIRDQVEVLRERERRVNQLLEEVETQVNAIIGQRKTNQDLVKIEPRTQKSFAFPTLPKLIKALFQPRKINIKNEI